MLGDVINGIIGPIFDATWNSLKSQYHSGLKDTELKQECLQAQRAIAQASAKYHQNYLDRHCNIKVLPGLMKEGMPLDTIYTAVKFLRNWDLRYFSSNLDDLEEQYRQANERRFRIGGDRRQDGLEVANQKQYLMVLGGPGVGKSTFLRKLGLDALEGRLTHNLKPVLPVFLELKSFKNDDMGLLQAIAKELKISGFPYSEKLVEAMLSGGKMLVLLDGLDEVSSKQMNAVIEQISNFCNQNNESRFVASCRSAAYKGGFNRFTDVTMAEFDNAQIEQFIRRWFSSELDVKSSTAKKFWELLQQPENASAKELAQTPLLLTFLCLVYDRSQSLPTVRSTLYGKALDILLEDWAAEKRIEPDPIYQGFHADLEKVLLSEIAYQSFKADQLFFSEQNITERITQFLADTLEGPKHLDGTAVLSAIEVQQGILVERATNAYSFSHLTLQEYLTARYISKKNLMQKLVGEYLTDNRWREVFLLVSGLLEERSQELWLLMKQQANTFLSSLKIQGFLEWAMSLSDSSLPSNILLGSRALILKSAIIIASESDRTSAIVASASDICSNSTIVGVRDLYGNRASAIAKAKAIASYSERSRDRANAIASALDSDISIASDNDSNLYSQRAYYINIDSISGRVIGSIRTITDVIEIVNESYINYSALSKKLEELKEQIPPNEAPSDAWKNFADQLLETFLTFFHLDKKLITFSLEEAEALNKYLYSVKLIIDCKNAAVRVSRNEWEAIEARLLTPQGEHLEDGQP